MTKFEWTNLTDDEFLSIIRSNFSYRRPTEENKWLIQYFRFIMAERAIRVLVPFITITAVALEIGRWINKDSVNIGNVDNL